MEKVFRFEELVINTILNTIKDNQEFLTKKENLPQLAKLGYMYNTLWYAGRFCFGYDGALIPEDVKEYAKKLKKEKPDSYWDDEDLYRGQCEDNPKYKIEMCDPINEKIENYIYDAWGMHIIRGGDIISWDKFYDVIFKGKPLTEFDKKCMKPQKTFDEWVEILTDKQYEYAHQDRRSVADHLLCVIGNGYGYKKGYVIREASGADQDVDDYGDWENCVFSQDIQKIVNEIMATPEVKLSIDTFNEACNKEKKEREKKEEERDFKIFGMSYKSFVESGKYNKLIEHFCGKEKKEKYDPYYPISEYSIITKLNDKSHPSYIKAGIEICEETLNHIQEEEKRDYNHSNVKFAKKFLEKFKK